FAGLAALLTAVGIYGIVAYSAARRTRELAIRAAIGAQRGQLLGLLVEKGLRPALAGVGVGLALSFALMPFLESLLFEVSTIDGPTFACVPLLMTALAAAASFFPARRASRMNPLEALRYEQHGSVRQGRHRHRRRHRHQRGRAPRAPARGLPCRARGPAPG